MEDEVSGRIYWPNSPEFMAAFEKSGAQWISADCHRSQYGYPFRVGLGLALENRHRAVTFVSLACSGAEVTEGLFLEMSAREGDQKKVAAQFDQMSDLICRGGAAGRTQTASYTLPIFSTGSTSISTQTVTKRWCAPSQRKRPIDLVLLSIGGNDVGFGALAVYSITDSANDIAPVADLIGRQVRFSPRTSRVYLDVLDERMKAVKDALRDGFGVDPSRVVHTSYEPIQFDETGAVCGANPTLGLDVHPKFRFSRERLQETSDFLREFLARLECVSNVRRRNRLSGGSRHRLRHRLPPGDRASGEIPQARHLRARSEPSGGRRRDDVGAAAFQDRRQVPAVFARHGLALCAALAPVPDGERRIHDGERPSRGHLAVRPAAARLFRPAKRRGPPDGRGPRDRGRSCDALRPRHPRQARGGAGRAAALRLSRLILLTGFAGP